MDRLTSLGQLSAGIAHEIRNPLASINFNVQFLARQLEPDEKTRRIIDDTLTGVDRIKGLVKGMLDFCRPAPPILKSESINRAVEDAVSLLESQFRKHDIRVELSLAPDAPDVVFDNQQIHQVIVNILLNAMQAMPQGGTVRVESHVEQDPKKPHRRLCIIISDSGVGIAKEDFPKIYDPFFTTKPEGTGLGLSIAHKILEQHHAVIEAKSRVGQGTTFILRFPIDERSGHVPA
jgi:signal transduction histidine kinase